MYLIQISQDVSPVVLESPEQVVPCGGGGTRDMIEKYKTMYGMDKVGGWRFFSVLHSIRRASTKIECWNR